MTELAAELNGVLSGTVAESLLSDFGRRIYFPRGIVAQSAEASERATVFNATVGMAFEDGQPVILPSVARHLTDLTARESVAYAPTPGVKELRLRWKEEMGRKNPSLDLKTVSLPMVTPGLTAGIAQVADLFVDRGDTVIIPDLFWGNYRLIFAERRQATISTFPLFDLEGRFNLSGFKEVLSGAPEQVTLLLNFPNNPTGYSPTVAEAERVIQTLVEAAESGKKILVISDDAYFGLAYEPAIYPESLFTPLSGAHENILAVKVDGATKEEFMWGLRLGFVTFGSRGLEGRHYDALCSKLMGSIRSSLSNSSNIAQHLLLKLLASDSYRAEKAAKIELLRQRYFKIKNILAARKTGKPLVELPFNSGYFMTFQCRNISAERLRQVLLREGIGTISVGEDYLRVAFSAVDITGLDDLYQSIFEAADKLNMS